MGRVYSIKARVVGFFHCRVCPRKATCDYSKRHAFIFLSYNLISSHIVYILHGWTVYHVPETGPPFLGIFLSNSSHFVPYPLSLVEEKDP